MSHAEPFEPLAESAPLAWSQAPRRCSSDAAGRGCASYHGVWQYLRLLGVITSVRTNTDFLIDAFRAVAGERTHLTALITGSADYSLLAHLKLACDLDGRALDVTVVDCCPTALWLNEWYGERVGLPIATHCADVLAYDVVRPVDLICTHNFMGRFDGDGRRRLVARWHAHLGPGGRVVTTMRVRPGCTDDVQVSYTDDEARALSAEVAALALTRPDLGVAPDDLAAAVYDYACGKRTYAIRTDQEITRLFVDQGFDIEQADEAGPAERTADRPSSAAGAETYRLRVVARKREPGHPSHAPSHPV